jgi:NTE family protein
VDEGRRGLALPVVASRRPDTAELLLAHVPLLAGVDARTLEVLYSDLRPVAIRAGDIVIRQGDRADRLFLVRSGRLRVLVEGEDGPKAVRELGPGSAIGELALLTGSPRSATVQAVRDSELLELDAEVFHELLERDAGFAGAVARTLAFQLQSSGELLPPSVRPSVISVGGPGRVEGSVALAGQLAAALRSFGRVSLLSSEDCGADRVAALDRAEQEHAFVVLAAAGDTEWERFCSRQSDRRVVFVTGDDQASVGIPDDADLVFAHDVPRARIESLLDLVTPRAHHHLDAGCSTASVGRVARRLAGRALGVVLSGGGARGFAHIGAIAALREAGLAIDRVGGCSIGSFIGALHAMDLDAEEMRDRCREELVRRSPFNDYTLPRVSLIRSRKAARMLDRVFGDALMEELPISFFTISADLLSSRPVVHRRGLVLEAVGASMSIPGLVPPLARSGRLLVDGGVLNNLPVDVMHADDEGPIVAVDVIRRLDELDTSVAPSVPSITETLSRATVLGSVERAERNRSLADLVVTPDVQDVALREFSALDRAADAGQAAMRGALESGGAEKLLARVNAPS